MGRGTDEDRNRKGRKWVFQGGPWSLLRALTMLLVMRNHSEILFGA